MKKLQETVENTIENDKKEGPPGLFFAYHTHKN
jgi:hypothetical protein